MIQRIVGIDPGLRYTGVADLTADVTTDGVELLDLRTRLEQTHPSASPTDDQTALRMTRQIRAVAPAGERTTCDACGHTATTAPDDLVMVVMEGPALHAKDQHADRNLGYWWRLRSIMVARGIPVAKCNPVHLKTWATGHGRATDDQMGWALERMWPRLLISTDHEVDAALLALTGAQWLGWHTLGEPLRQAAELAKMTWPKLPEGVGR